MFLNAFVSVCIVVCFFAGLFTLLLEDFGEICCCFSLSKACN